MSSTPGVSLKFSKLQQSIQQSLTTCKELISEYEQLHFDTENYKSQFLSQKEKCENKNCSSSETLKEIILAKERTIQAVASALSRLNETKNFRIINEIFNIICGEPNVVTPPKSNECVKSEPEESIEDVSFHDISESEIEGTPTGRKSPIIQSKNLSGSHKSSDNSKKKCPANWPKPEEKQARLTLITPTRRKPGEKYKQSRLNLIRKKKSHVIDLTCSPQFSGGARVSHEDGKESLVNIKKESIENDDTIMPSPTSASDFKSMYKSTSVSDSPNKFKKPLTNAICKMEPIEQDENIPDQNVNNMEDSINILQQLPNRFILSPEKEQPIKKEIIDTDVTHCEMDSSVSLLNYMPKPSYNKIESKDAVDIKLELSPSKRPLEENMNVTNIPAAAESPSILNQDVKPKTAPSVDVKRFTVENVQPLYKEPTVRKKAEKLALPGWSCDECKIFYDELYKDDPVMLAKKMGDCSRHRGRHNPARPRTPPGLWNPRWNVPNDTEEFNRRNNAQ